MADNTVSLELDEALTKFVEESIASGNYQDTNEVITAGLKLLKEQEEAKKMDALKAAIDAKMDEKPEDELDLDAMFSDHGS